MQKQFSPNFIKVCGIQSYFKMKRSVTIIEDPETHKKFVQKIFSTKTSKVDINSYCNADIIKLISIYQGILPIICFSCQPYPTVITEYKANGTLKNFIAKRTNKKQIYTDSKTLMILFGIAETMRYLQIHDLYLYKFDSSKIYLDENFLPQIDISELLLTKSPPKYDKNRSKDNVSSFGHIAYELITGQTNLNKSKINIEWLNQLINKCIAKNKKLRPNFDEITNEFKEQNKNYEFITKEEIDKYEEIQK